MMEKLCCQCEKELFETGDKEGTKGLMGVLETLKRRLKAGVGVKKGHDKHVEGLNKAGADVNKALQSAAQHVKVAEFPKLALKHGVLLNLPI